jgi:predicted nucleic acid-binding protein
MLVIDANIAVRVILPIANSGQIIRQFKSWRAEHSRIVAPALWTSECTSAICRYVHAKTITPEDGESAVRDLFRLGVRVIPDSPAISIVAFRWAQRLQQSRAYDGFYLALAETVNAPPYTADSRLFNAAQARNLDWVRWIGEEVDAA